MVAVRGHALVEVLRRQRLHNLDDGQRVETQRRTANKRCLGHANLAFLDQTLDGGKFVVRRPFSMRDLNLIGLFWQVGYSHARRESVESQRRTSRLASSLGPASVPTLEQFHQTLRLYKNRDSREVAAKRPFDAGVGLDGRFIFTASDSVWALQGRGLRPRRPGKPEGKRYERHPLGLRSVFNGLVPRPTTTRVRVRELGGGCSGGCSGRKKGV